MAASSGISRRRLLASGAAGALAATIGGVWTRVQAEDEVDVTRCSESVARVDPTPSQTMQGFGASGAWWPNDLIKFDSAVQEHVADLLFGPGGIALSVYGYNIGGGGIGVTHAGHDPETLLVSPGTYDWSRGRGGRRRWR